MAGTKQGGNGTGSGAGRFDWRTFALLGAIYLVVAYFWHTQWVYPLKLIVVFLHEISHGIAAVATGGRIVEIQLHQGEAGHCVTAGGNPALIYSAGYLGSLLFGVVILLLSTRTRAERAVSVILGLLLGGVAAAFVPLGANTFGKVFGILTGALLVALGTLPRVWPAMVLRVVAVTSCLYAILDIKSDVLDRPGLDSDAVRLAEVTNISAQVWGGLWIGVSVLVTFSAGWIAVRRRPQGDRVDSKTGASPG